MRHVFLFLALALAAGCASVKPQQGGRSTTTLGGAAQPTTVTTAAPENPATPSTTTVEKTTTREFQASSTEPTEPSPQRAPSKASDSVPSVSLSPASVTKSVPVPALLRETTTERAVTTTGTAQKDTARDLSVRLANFRGVLWVGLALLIGGPVIGWRMGWFTNGCIAGAVGLLLVILSAVLPGNEAWFGLVGLLLIPLVAYVYYRAHHDATQPKPPAA